MTLSGIESLHTRTSAGEQSVGQKPTPTADKDAPTLKEQFGKTPEKHAPKNPLMEEMEKIQLKKMLAKNPSSQGNEMGSTSLLPDKTPIPNSPEHKKGVNQGPKSGWQH